MTSSTKRKGPPTFQHLPTNRAIKLKKTWVEVKKIKSKWRMQKKKEGIQERLGPRQNAEPILAGVDEDNVEAVEKDDKPEDDTLHNKPHGKASNKQLSKLSPEDSPKESVPRPSPRELARQAYSRNSLHTFKSDPLHRKRGSSHIRGGGENPARGGGQPNMKLRMDAMLEKIKRDYP